ncbi:DUF4345 family protein [Zestomonas thermotolerans]|jgi:hypothetical protein|uniref:DUF4345 family protein n=1 Tax=Zestomonas thermotolerans TaxID=157784 RepID=UPI0004B67F6A|nr:DUF4345 family protein [Pseudomonas thermotolerans]
MTFARIILAIQILILGGVGMAYWVRPYEMANLNGLLLMESISVINVRVWLGGLQVGLALFLGWTLRDRASIRSGLMLVMLLQGTLALARITAVWLDRDSLLLEDYSALSVKVFTALLAGLALWRLDLLERREALAAQRLLVADGGEVPPQD